MFVLNILKSDVGKAVFLCMLNVKTPSSLVTCLI